MLPLHLNYPHIEVNEDGKQFQHPGYTEVKCPRCGRYFRSAVGVVTTTCGYKDCGKEKI